MAQGSRPVHGDGGGGVMAPGRFMGMEEEGSWRRAPGRFMGMEEARMIKEVL